METTVVHDDDDDDDGHSMCEIMYASSGGRGKYSRGVRKCWFHILALMGKKLIITKYCY